MKPEVVEEKKLREVRTVTVMKNPLKWKSKLKFYLRLRLVPIYEILKEKWKTRPLKNVLCVLRKYP